MKAVAMLRDGELTILTQSTTKTGIMMVMNMMAIVNLVI